MGKASRLTRLPGVKFLYTFVSAPLSHSPPDNPPNRPDLRGYPDYQFQPARLAPSMLNELVSLGRGRCPAGDPCETATSYPHAAAGAEIASN